ncbi:hypothetical protein ERX46_17020 [Brumimicrobium glaciale]|uniref:Outer membrane protein beta-barrel domain-containing protein n=1 Tax=Brumimicrobium glaciale TaxID=200475 RepID=A0A4Q4KCQ2_9FLAO|nr:outer membrane beta-barrel protein [Brumimicrobium glaciale]RYM30782.1 hypothetical protein ERX46_17020 [Brumimicrobium glaciale]
MKKLKIITAGLLSMFAILSLNSFNAQVLTKGDFLFDAYIGSPKTYELTNRNDVKRFEREDGYLIYSGIAPIGIRTEYMISNRIGLGFDASYTDLKISSLSYGNAKFHEYKSIATMLTFNYHFLKSSEKFDLYGTLGVGAALRSSTEISYIPKYQREDYVYDYPLALKIGLGARYFITDKIGVNLSVGYGEGGFVNGGISIKF